jgi:hypothetical protein
MLIAVARHVEHLVRRRARRDPDALAGEIEDDRRVAAIRIAPIRVAAIGITAVRIAAAASG